MGLSLFINQITHILDENKTPGMVVLTIMQIFPYF